jgi:hypothetical protein
MRVRNPVQNHIEEIALHNDASPRPDAGWPSREGCKVLPSFFVVGPPRTGTSWLHEVLKRHTNLPSPTRETRFFDDHYHRGLRWYEAHFLAPRGDRPSGEVAPTYFASARARERIAETIPHAKLIFSFRDPLERVVSLYRMKRAYGMFSWSLEEALSRDPELVASGRYATNLKQWQQVFPRNQLLITIYDDLQSEPQTFVDGVCDFLRIRHIPLSERQLKRVHSSEALTEPRWYLATRSAILLAEWCKARRLDQVVAAARNSVLMKLFLGGGAPFPEVSKATLDMLGEMFRPEVDELEAMVGRRLPAWKQMDSALSI